MVGPVRLRSAIPLVVVAVLALGMAMVPAASVGAPATHACPTFTGPGDNLIHSKDFRVANVSCAVGKRVVETCLNNGKPCRISGSTWVCHAHRIPGQTHCRSGRKVAEIFWLD
jgi:hypothetical protein